MSEELHDLMTAVDVPPSRADVGRAVAVGRRRSRRRAVFGAAAAVLVVAGSVTAFQQVNNRASAPAPVPVGSPPSAAPPPGCRVETYATVGTVEAVDESGRYLVGTRYNGNTPTPVRWLDGKPTPLAGATGTPVAVNRGGVVAGFDSNDQDQYQGWVWRDGKVTHLAEASGYKWTMPQGINARGDVVGYAMGNALDLSIPVLWPADRPGTVVKLKLPSGVGVKGVSMSRATGIGDDGTIVGVVKGAPVRWKPDGTGSALPLPSADNNGGYASGIRGHVAFGFFYGKGIVDVVRWDLTAGTLTSMGPDSGGMLSGTSSGWVVTWGEDKDPAARISPDGRRIPLTQPTGGGALAMSMSDDGATIVGFVAGTAKRPVVWHCSA